MMGGAGKKPARERAGFVLCDRARWLEVDLQPELYFARVTCVAGDTETCTRRGGEDAGCEAWVGIIQRNVRRVIRESQSAELNVIEEVEDLCPELDLRAFRCEPALEERN